VSGIRCISRIKRVLPGFVEVFCGFVMITRMALFFALLFWTAYESRFSPQFFFDTVGLSLANIEGGLERFVEEGATSGLKTASATD
jgi:hypothetical protein